MASKKAHDGVPGKAAPDPVDHRDNPVASRRSPSSPQSRGQTRRRGGGPKTAQGKAVSSRNATRHGIFSNDPTIAGEDPAAWEDHLQGYRQSLQPQTYYEENLTNEIALNRWRRDRLERWDTEMVRQQLERVSLQTREGIEQQYHALPEDERAWYGIDATEVRATLDELSDENLDSPIAASVVAGVTLAVERGLDLPGGTVTSRLPDPSSLPDNGEWTLVELRMSLVNLASERELAFDHLLTKARAETDNALLLQTVRARQEGNMNLLRATQALMPSPQQGDRYLRYAAHLDRAFERSMGLLENAQRARSNDLPTRVHLEVEHL